MSNDKCEEDYSFISADNNRLCIKSCGKDSNG